MAIFTAVLTDSGADILARAIANKEYIDINRAEAGYGVYDGVKYSIENLVAPSNIKMSLGSMTFDSIQGENRGFLNIRIMALNEGLTQPVPIREIGLYVGNTLFAYSWLEGEDTDNILPPPLDINVTDSIHTHILSILISNRENEHIEISFSFGDFVTHGYLEQRLEGLGFELTDDIIETRHIQNNAVTADKILNVARLDTSVALGSNSTALGSNSIAVGAGSTASGSNSTALGNYSIASGAGCIALGGAPTEYEASMGLVSNASDFWSIVVGVGGTASGSHSIVVGAGSTASDLWSTVVGGNSTALGFNGTALGGRTTASGSGSTALGGNSTASHDGSWAINTFSRPALTQASRTTATNQALLAGTTGTPTAYRALSVISDERDKAEITPLKYDPLEFINKVEPKQYKLDFRCDYSRLEEVTDKEYEELDEYTKQHKVQEIPVYSIDGEVEFIDYPLEEDTTRSIQDKFKTKLKSKVLRSREEAISIYKDIQLSKRTNVEDLTDEDIQEKIAKVRDMKLVRVEQPKDGSRTNNRYHNGVLAQQVKEVADEMGFDFCGFKDHAVNGGDDLYSITYEEFIAPMIGAIQQLTKEAETQEEKIKGLEDMVEALNNKLKA